jgi:hypothetical protein
MATAVGSDEPGCAPTYAFHFRHMATCSFCSGDEAAQSCGTGRKKSYTLFFTHAANCAHAKLQFKQFTIRVNPWLIHVFIEAKFVPLLAGHLALTEIASPMGRTQVSGRVALLHSFTN